MAKKIRRIMGWTLGIVLVALAAWAVVEAFTIDNFERSDFKKEYTKISTWYTFGDSNVAIEKVTETTANKYSTEAGKLYLAVKGHTENWYVGGMGKEIKKDLTPYTHVQMLVYGKGKNKGKLAIELYDDDNNNDKVEMDANYIALSDDKFVFEMDIDWVGWRLITIPLTDFVDKNQGVGDDVFNPEAKNGSAGLLSFQLIFLTQEQAGDVDFGVDQIKFINNNTPANKLVVDDYEDNDLKFDQGTKEAWWTFGKLNYKIITEKLPEKNTDKALDETIKATGKGILEVKGHTEEWYVGGFGKYLALDASAYTSVKMMVRGNGKNSGIIKVEMYDDDNNTTQLEQDAQFNPLLDDKWVAQVNVNWKGWKAVELPFYKFKDANPGIGNDIFDMDKKNGSGGLLHFQIIVNSNTKVGDVDMAFDNIKLVP